MPIPRVEMQHIGGLSRWAVVAGVASAPTGRDASGRRVGSEPHPVPTSFVPSPTVIGASLPSYAHLLDNPAFIADLNGDLRAPALARKWGTGETFIKTQRRIITGDAPYIGKLGKETRNTRILTLDIEWRPMLSYHWGLWDQNISIIQVKEHGGMLCFAAKWMGDKEVLFYSTYHDGYRVMLEKAHELLSEADIVIGYNSDRYDIKKINQSFALAGMGPPKPFKSIDLLRTNKGRFDLPSRKLDYLVQQLSIGKKLPHTGFQLWLDCMDDDPKAWDLMRRYNIQDVNVTEKAYLRLLPWLTNTPHLGMYMSSGDGFVCPYCGGRKLRRDGETHTNVQSYPLYNCGNCQGWSRGTVRMQDPTHTRAIR